MQRDSKVTASVEVWYTGKREGQRSSRNVLTGCHGVNEPPGEAIKGFEKSPASPAKTVSFPIDIEGVEVLESADEI